MYVVPFVFSDTRSTKLSLPLVASIATPSVVDLELPLAFCSAAQVSTLLTRSTHATMDDLRQQQSRRPDQRSTIAPSTDKGPRRLAFRIRRRGFTFEGRPSLLISNRYGLWSVTHRRYIHKTRYHRFHDLKKELDPIRKLVNKAKMSRWPVYRQDEQLRSLRRKLAEFYWGVMPEEERARTAQLYHDRRERRRAKELPFFAAAVVCTAVGGYVLLRLVLMGCYSLPVSLFLGSAYLLAVYLLDMAWHL